MGCKIKRRVFVIGLDSASFSIIDVLRKKGKLPNIDSLIREGVKSNLYSTIPPISSTAHVSLFTGKNPGKTNIYSYRDKYGNIINSKHVKSKFLWEILEKYDLKSIVINVAVTYPQRSCSTILVSGLLTPENKSISNYININKLLNKLNYEIYMSDIESFKLYDSNNYEFLNRWIDIDYKRLLLVEELMNSIKDWDLFIIWLTLPDPIHHYFGVSPNNEYIIKCYRMLDTFCGRLLTKIDKNINTIILSDHGIAPSVIKFNINVWLRKQKYLFLKGGWLNNIKKLLNILNLTTSKISIMAQKNSFFKKIVNIMPISLGEVFKNTLSEKVNLLSNIDIEKSIAYGFSSIYGLIYINNNIKNKVHYINIIKKDLENIVDEFTKRKVFNKIYEKDSIYIGENIINAPDLILVPSHGYSVSEALFKRNLFSKSPLKGTHSRDGILIMNGPDIKSGIEIKNTSILDISPTISYFLSIPIQEDMDGVVLNKCFINSSTCIQDETLITSRILSKKDIIRSKIQKMKIKYELN